MIMRKWLYGILALIMVVQAVVTVAYVHQSEQSGLEYVSFSHDADLPLSAGQTGSETPDNDFGCHHCCHCTGIFPPLINGALKTVISAEKHFGYGLRLPSALISPHLRPPIL